jgi:hypothetical protein
MDLLSILIFIGNKSYNDKVVFQLPNFYRQPIRLWQGVEAVLRDGIRVISDVMDGGFSVDLPL